MGAVGVAGFSPVGVAPEMAEAEAKVIMRRAVGGVRVAVREPGGAGAQHAFHVVEVGGEFGAASAVGREAIPVVLEQRLLQVAVAEPTGAEPVFEIDRDFPWGDEA